MRGIIKIGLLCLALLVVGIGYAQNTPTPAEIERWETLAEQGNPIAQYNLGDIYFSGDGVKQDYTKAKDWWEKAAQQGYVRAQIYLGYMYYEGNLFPKSYVHAYMWWTIAAANGDEIGKKKIEHISKEMSYAGIEKAQQKAVNMVEAYPKLMNGE